MGRGRIRLATASGATASAVKSVSSRSTRKTMLENRFRHALVGCESSTETKEGVVPPVCASCGDAGMVVRYRRRDGKAFWGCFRFPHCRYTLELRPGDHGVDDGYLRQRELAIRQAIFRTLELWGSMTFSELCNALSGRWCQFDGGGEVCYECPNNLRFEVDTAVDDAVDDGWLSESPAGRLSLRSTPEGMIPLSADVKAASLARATHPDREKWLLRCGRCGRPIPERVAAQSAVQRTSLDCSGCGSRFTSSDSREVLSILSRWRLRVQRHPDSHIAHGVT